MSKYILLTNFISKKLVLNGQVNQLIIVKEDITQKELSKRTGASLRTIVRTTKQLQQQGFISREGSKKTGKWAVNNKGNEKT